jgi:hypothetical protein
MDPDINAVKDKYNLYAHILKGISIFHPDLAIDPKVFERYFIHQSTWQINRKSSVLIF